ncbi:MAG: YbaB/EbfC family nucleoid-associated protein [Planctomycetota bacterium]
MFGDLGKIMKMARDVKEKMPAMRAELEASHFSADAGGGAVSATVDGKGTLTDLTLSAEAVADGDAALLADLVKAAVSTAQAKAHQAAADMMKELTGGTDLPGVNGLDGLFG